MLSTFRAPLMRALSLRAVTARSYSAAKESDDDFDSRWESYFKRPTLDGWELRKGINDMQGFDNFPEPRIVVACLEACRRLNEPSLATRYLEALRWKAGKDAKVIYPWLIQEIRPTLDKLKIATPEDLGYEKPEFGLKSVFEMKGPNDY
ncbi:cytochrome c oxidase subunit mitochondrial [Brachionus plicatilis]|uniref:Cytochrome c oxidase subunit 5A, mitochondrial n=1 Tax=Brachionus plicatilis TaxID=10195 RepID=A0A3M7SXB1_BRAPC|nr:cytochrome c oxidase subunit mitochondrial [Brachionus plicatilis]